MSTGVAEADQKTTLREDLKALMGSPRELWLVLSTKLLEYIGFFSLYYVLILWLSKDLAMGDEAAGSWFGVFATVTSLFAFAVGFLVDSIGFRTTMIGAFALSTIARVTMSTGHGKAVPLIGLMILAFGVAAGTPAMNAALRRYTTGRTRAIAFALYYTSFNIGGAIAGFIVDGCRSRFAADDPAHPGKQIQIFKTVHLPIVGDKSMSAYSMVFFIGISFSIAAFLVACFLRKGIDAEKIEAEKSGGAKKDEAPKPVEEGAKKPPWAIAREVMSEKAFWRFMLFIGLLSLVKLVFIHYHATWPKYVLRTIGESFPLGRFQSINPIAIIVLVPIATALTRKRSAFKCIVVGSFISTMSMFVLMGPATMGVQILAVAFLTLGEAIWSPRLYEYTAEIAPKGREGSYMGLSQMPYFFAKMMAGPMSGFLLARYCPEQGERHPWILWGAIALMTLAGPVLIVLLRRVIEGKKPEEPAPISVPAESDPSMAAMRTSEGNVPPAKVYGQA